MGASVAINVGARDTATSQRHDLTTQPGGGRHNTRTK